MASTPNVWIETDRLIPGSVSPHAAFANDALVPDSFSFHLWYVYYYYFLRSFEVVGGVYDGDASRDILGVANTAHPWYGVVHRCDEGGVPPRASLCVDAPTVCPTLTPHASVRVDEPTVCPALTPHASVRVDEPTVCPALPPRASVRVDAPTICPAHSEPNDADVVGDFASMLAACDDELLGDLDFDADCVSLPLSDTSHADSVIISNARQPVLMEEGIVADAQGALLLSPPTHCSEHALPLDRSMHCSRGVGATAKQWTSTLASMRRLFKCRACGKTYQTRDGARKHCRRNHGLVRLGRRHDEYADEVDEVVPSRCSAGVAPFDHATHS